MTQCDFCMMIFLLGDTVESNVYSFLGATNDSARNDIEKFGLYQVVMFAFLSVPLILSAGFTLSYVFTAGEVKYRYACACISANLFKHSLMHAESGYIIQAAYL